MAGFLRRSAPLYAFALFLPVAVMLVSACPGSDPTGNRGLEIVASAFNDHVAPGEDATVQVVLSRQNFPDAVVLHQTLQDKAHDPWFDDVTVAAGVSTATLTVHTAVTMSLSVHTIAISALSLTGGSNATGFFQLTLIQPGTFQLTTSPGFPDAGPGALLSTTVHIARSNFSQPVTLVAIPTPGSGITASFVGANPTTADDVVMNVTVPNNATAADYTIIVNGTGGAAHASVTSGLRVISASASTVSFTFCPSSGLPIVVAAQDGNGAWAAVTGVNDVYSFPITTGKGGVAYVVPRSVGTQMVVLYGDLADLRAQGAEACAGGTGAVKTINGTTVNTGAATNVALSFGGGFNFLGGAPGSFQFGNVGPGMVDLVGATLVSAGGNTQLARMLLRSGQNLADGGTLGTVDFTGAGSFAPATATLSLQNTLGHIVSLSEFYHTTNNAFSPLYVETTASTSATHTIYGPPVASRIDANDVLWISADALTGSGLTTEFRTTAKGQSSPSDVTLTFGPALDAPQISVLASLPYPRLRALFLRQQQYPTFWQVDFVQSSGANRRVLIQATSGYRGTDSPVVLDIPDLSGVVGWFDTYGLAPGVQASWKVTAAKWSLSGVTFPPISSGSDYQAATKQGVVTP